MSSGYLGLPLLSRDGLEHPDWASKGLIGEAIQVWSFMTSTARHNDTAEDQEQKGLHECWLFMIPLCFLCNLAGRVWSFYWPSFESAELASHMLLFVSGSQEFFANLLGSVTIVLGLLALRSDGLKELAEFKEQVKPKQHDWRRVLFSRTESRFLRFWFRQLAIGPLLFLMAFAGRVVIYRSPPPSLIWIWIQITSGQAETLLVFFYVSYLLLVCQIMIGAVIGARVFSGLCFSAIGAVEEELDADYEKHKGHKLQMILTHRNQLSEKMDKLWSAMQAGMAYCCALILSFSLCCSNGVNLLILVADGRRLLSDPQHFLAYIVAFFIGAAMLSLLLYDLASITQRAKALVPAMRRYTERCLQKHAVAIAAAAGIENLTAGEKADAAPSNTPLTAAAARKQGGHDVAFSDPTTPRRTSKTCAAAIITPEKSKAKEQEPAAAAKQDGTTLQDGNEDTGHALLPASSSASADGLSTGGPSAAAAAPVNPALIEKEDRHELLTARLLFESQTVSVKLMGTIDVSFSLVVKTSLKLFVYIPAIFSFFAAFFSHSHTSTALCQQCIKIANATAWVCTSCTSQKAGQ